MVHIDLNPIRVNIASSLDNYDHASIKLCIVAAIKGYQRLSKAIKGYQSKSLLAFTGDIQQKQDDGIAFTLTESVEFIDETSCIMRENKSSSIDESLHYITDNAQHTTDQLA